MKAIIAKKYGPPEQLQLLDIPIPSPKPGEVLIKGFEKFVGSIGALLDNYGLFRMMDDDDNNNTNMSWNMSSQSFSKLEHLSPSSDIDQPYR